MVKTIARPRCLLRLLESLRNFYPDTSVVVADDGRPEDQEQSMKVCMEFDAEFVSYIFNSGAPACYNDMVKNFVKTEYVCLLDDDFVFTEQSRIEDLLVWVQAGVFDVMGGCVVARGSMANFIGNLRYTKTQVVFERMFAGMTDAQKGPLQADVIPNFWAAETDALKAVPWDGEQKVFRHLDWFMYAKYVCPGEYMRKAPALRVGYLNTVRIDHQHQQSGTYYEDLRHGAIPEYRQRFCKKWDVHEVIGD